MTERAKNSNSESLTEIPVVPLIGEVLGVTSILPGESEARYTAGINAVIEELDAMNTLQVYLAAKVCDCLWWIRRYEDKKRITIISEMAHQAEKRFSRDLTQKKIDVCEALLSYNINSRVMKTIGKVGHSIESLR